ncbi:3'-5' exonuclease [Scheffersomyces spartinae]|uniref:RNA exonuclease 4 n=1 Tax=Scheffersomyces spartinae TaxID=45513 RepID=A0A9P8AJC0_9ASCO|nr:3'-5' exonuclease [Scheffersomyces spartinae]KAG7194610.1 3'-5' exonuclease [Scheffersomyces spartinae]
MSGLSLNWKRLSKLIDKGNGASKGSSKGSVSKKTNRKSAKRGTVSPVPSSTIEKTLIRTVSALEYALWTQETQITVDKLELDTKRSLKIAAHVSDERKKDIGKYIAIDCEFVGIGHEGKESALARVSIVNFYGHILLDKFVKPREKVTDWRTWVSGVTPKHMVDAITFQEAQRLTSELLQNRILVGHAVHHDLESLYLSHPRSKIRDTSRFKPFRAISKGRTPSLKNLSLHFLKLDIQSASHSSVEDARATMLLFRLYRKDFEKMYK